MNSIPGFKNSFLEDLKPGYCPTIHHRETTEWYFKEHQYDLLAEHFRTQLDIPKLMKIVALKID
jgi:hypothetical protein